MVRINSGTLTDSNCPTDHFKYISILLRMLSN